MDATDPILAVWLFAAGACVGSFLNVVAYRVPRGMSLIEPGSHCPACKHPIRWRDNIPVLGWMLLAGRCRDCRSPISPRYPIVEAITAALFLAVGLVEGLWLGENLPRRPLAVTGGAIHPSLDLAQSLGITFYHLFLLGTLLAAALIEYDGELVPWRLAAPTLAVGMLAPMAWSYLHPVPAFSVSSVWPAGLLDGVAGAAAGGPLGLASWRLIGPKSRRSLAIAPACAGLFLGWQAVIVLAALVLTLHLGSLLVERLWPPVRRISPGFWWLFAALAWVLLWRPIAQRWPILGL